MKYNELKDCMLVKHLIKDIDSNAGWLCFFLIFSRFEYALKRSGCITGNQEYVKADWKKFSKKKTAQNKFNNLKARSERLKKAIEYLKSKPPKIQIQNNSKLDWGEKSLNEGDFEGCIDAVKRVRNNLFHGGKFPSGKVKDPSRDNELIKHSITVLKHLLDSSDEVQNCYF